MTLVTTTPDADRNDALIKAVGFDRLNPAQRELALAIAARYDLDPLLKHLVMIEGKVYITRDGLLHVAHRSGHFDGIEVEPPVLDDAGKFWRTVATVYRKDMTRPFRYPGRYPAQGGNQRYNEEMCIKVAEVMTLRRAFDVAAPVLEERWAGDADDDVETDEPKSLADVVTARVVAIEAPVEPESVVEDVETPDETSDEPETPATPGVGLIESDESDEVEETPTPVVATPYAGPDAGLSYTEFLELARAYDRDLVRLVAKSMFPAGPTKFADLTPADRQRIIDELAVRAAESELVDGPPSTSDPIVDPLFDGAPATKSSTGHAVLDLCGEPSPYSPATCTLDKDHRVPVSPGVNHRAGVSEAW